MPATGQRPELWRVRLTGWRKAVAITILTGAAVVVLRPLGWLGAAFVWPLIMLSCGLALVLRQVAAGRLRCEGAQAGLSVGLVDRIVGEGSQPQPAPLMSGPVGCTGGLPDLEVLVVDPLGVILGPGSRIHALRSGRASVSQSRVGQTGLPRLVTAGPRAWPPPVPDRSVAASWQRPSHGPDNVLRTRSRPARPRPAGAAGSCRAGDGRRR